MAPGDGKKISYPDLRDWLRRAEAAGQLRLIEGVDWRLEIGALTEMFCMRSAAQPCLLFDKIKDYPPGWRVVSNSFGSHQLAAMALNVPVRSSYTELVQAWREKAKTLELLPVRRVETGPIFENVCRGADIDLYKFPTPLWHEEDGGRYIGTGSSVITRDPDTGQLNAGTYRIMILDKDHTGLWIDPGGQGRIHREKYFERGEPMPVAIVFGMEPLLMIASSLRFPPTTFEYEWVGGVRGLPVEVIEGPVTGLPFPAHAEIVVEGFVHPGKTRDEGPFGEFTGYYASSVQQETFVEVKALYHRNEPIILGSPPMRPPGPHLARSVVLDALTWDEIEAAGVPDVRGVSHLLAAGVGMVVVSIKQRYPGHAKQAGTIAAQCHAALYLGRYVVVVDEDIDPHSVDDVLWALWTRSDPAESLDVIHNCLSTPLDPRVSPAKRAIGDFTSSRLIIDATRPYHWRDRFPKVNVTSAKLESEMLAKWGADFFR